MQVLCQIIGAQSAEISWRRSTFPGQRPRLPWPSLAASSASSFSFSFYIWGSSVLVFSMAYIVHEHDFASIENNCFLWAKVNSTSEVIHSFCNFSSLEIWRLRLQFIFQKKQELQNNCYECCSIILREGTTYHFSCFFSYASSSTLYPCQ